MADRVGAGDAFAAAIIIKLYCPIPDLFSYLNYIHFYIYPMESGKYRLLDERYRQIAYDLILPLHNIKPTLPIPAGGVYPGIVPKITSELGFDCAISAGGAIHGHPLGATAGAKAFRQAIDAVVANIDLDEYAKNHEELKVALEKWG